MARLSANDQYIASVTGGNVSTWYNDDPDRRSRLTESGRRSVDRLEQRASANRASYDHFREYLIEENSILLDANEIYYVKNISKPASYSMDRWINTHPTIRNEVLLRGRHARSFTTSDMTTIGDENYDYRRVRSGVVVHGKTDSYAIEYHEKVLYDHDMLSIDEKEDIALTHKVIDRMTVDAVNNYFDDEIIYY